MNNDGKPDVVFAEMQDSVQKRVGFFLNQGQGKSWKLQVVATTGSHNIRVAVLFPRLVNRGSVNQRVDFRIQRGPKQIGLPSRMRPFRLKVKLF